MNRSHSQTMIVVFKICKSHLRAFTSTVIKAQTTQRGAKSLGRDAFPVFRVISSCSGKQQRAIDQLHGRYYYTPNTSQTPLYIAQYGIIRANNCDPQISHRLEICRDRCDRRSCKIFVSCVNFSRKQCSFFLFCKFTHT